MDEEEVVNVAAPNHFPARIIFYFNRILMFFLIESGDAVHGAFVEKKRAVSFFG